MKNLNHPNVINLIGICWQRDNLDDSPRIAPLIVLPYMELGDLKKFLRNVRLQEMTQVLTCLPMVISMYNR